MMRVLFAGSDAIGLPSLRVLTEHGLIRGVLTAPDHRKKRNPIKQYASSNAIPVLQPERLGSDARKLVSELAPNCLVVFSYGKIFGPRFLALFEYGGINIHPSLLPRYRGASPIPSAILNGDDKTGITVQLIANEMDAGDIVAQEEILLDGDETSLSVAERVADRGARVVWETLSNFHTIIPVPQDHSQATYCRKIEKNDGRVDWRSAAIDIERMTRAYTPWPGVFCYAQGARISLLQVVAITGDNVDGGDVRKGPPGTVLGAREEYGILVRAGDGILGIQRLQREYRQACGWRDFLHGQRQLLQANFE